VNEITLSIRYLILIGATVFLASCGGGGGSDSPPQVKSYPITDNAILKYLGGEVLEYNFSYYQIYTDGSGEASANGTEAVYIYSGYSFDSFPDKQNEIYKHITVIDAQGLSGSTNDFYFYDDSNNYIHWLTSNNNYYTNPDSPSSGSLVMQSNLVEGNSWTNNPLVIVYDGRKYTGTRTFTVIKKEFVSVPFGNVEAYQVNYSGSFSSSPLSGNNLDITGTVWIHPKIGIIKNIESIHILYPIFDASATIELISVNWSIE
jgi:hypothetical protein